MGLLDRCKKIVDIKIDKRKGQRGGATEGDIGTFGDNDAISDGSIGSLDGLDFTVLGRLVYDWGGGYWEEFYLEFLDTEEHKWLSKEGTTIELIEEMESIGVPDPESLKEGDVFELQGEKVRVSEVSKARITSVSGSFPWNIVPGTQVAYADCNFERTGEILSLERPVGSRLEVYKGYELSKNSLSIY